MPGCSVTCTFCRPPSGWRCNSDVCRSFAIFTQGWLQDLHPRRDVGLEALLQIKVVFVAVPHVGAMRGRCHPANDQ